ncbi:MAG: hypothetical protein ACR2JJ_06525 [Sphingomicrobium sp.]
MPTGGLLFSDYFLKSGVEDLPEWADQAAGDLAAARETIEQIISSAADAASMNESETERLVVEPLLDLLGWSSRLTQQNLSPFGRSDVPDFLLFADTRSMEQARLEPAQNRRYRYGRSFLEAKPWQVALDRASGGSAPSTQMLRYLSLAEAQSDQRIRFGLLTNGRLWRLYDQKARSRAEEFLEIDLLLVARPIWRQVPMKQIVLSACSSCSSQSLPSDLIRTERRSTSAPLAKAGDTKSESQERSVTPFSAGPSGT